MFQFARTSAKAVVVAASAAGFIAFGTGFAGADVLGDTVAPGTVPGLKFGLAGQTPDLSESVSAPKTDNLTTSTGDMSHVGPQSQAKVDKVQGTLDSVTETVGLSHEIEHQRSGPDLNGALNSNVDEQVPGKPGGTHKTLHGTVSKVHGAANTVHNLDAEGLTKAKGLPDVNGLAGAKNLVKADGLPVVSDVGGGLPVVGDVAKPSKGTNGAVQKNISHQRAVDTDAVSGEHPLPGGASEHAPSAPSTSNMPQLPVPVFPLLASLKQLAGGAAQPGAIQPTSNQVDVPTDQVPTDQVPTDQVPTGQLPTNQLPTDSLTSDLPSLGALQSLLSPEKAEVTEPVEATKPVEAKTLPADVKQETANDETTTDTVKPTDAVEPAEAQDVPADVDVNATTDKAKKAPLLDLSNAGLVGDLAGNAGLQDALPL
ncbi:hypothetical protein CDO52_01330 [Nocardiopsis gilva YIM 90087]|uniref:Uncharacterized protein n=1 Tax=Nocardiopsis gilva YIM 90087 TaxID=1235441 RepID=A0A223S0J7_9ACTN|nr:hypothetical protein [Nocardiopsis gilva]ASU81617.1 hypothetical protein CDO52_01330 [Nocardiopsis gilva YIM 90087]